MKLSLFQNLYFSESVSAIHQAAETRSVFLCVDTSSWHDSGYQISGNNNTYLLRETRSRAENNHIYKYVVLSCIYRVDQKKCVLKKRNLAMVGVF